MHKFLPTLLLLALTACATTPDLPEIEADIPATWSEQAAIEDQQAVANIPNWRTFFPQPQVQSLIEQALANNRDMRSALLRVKKNAALAGVAQSNRWPTLQGIVGYQSSRTPADLSQGGKTSFLNRHDLGVSLPTYEIDLWGKLTNLAVAGEQRHFASEENSRALRVVLMAQVVEALLRWREMVEHVLLAEQIVANRQEVLHLSQNRHTAGLAPQRAVLEASANLENSRAELAEWQRQKNSTYHGLALLVAASQPLSTSWPSLEEMALDTPLQAGVPSQILWQRPDIQAAEHQLLAANGDVAAARAALFPRITLTATGGLASKDLVGLFQGGSGAWNFLPTITIPIFELPRRHMEVTAAEAEEEIVKNGYEKAIQQGFREVAESLAVQQILKNRHTALQEGIKQRQERYLQEEARYKIGLDGRLELLEVEKDLLQARHPYLAAKQQQLAGRVQLFKVLGGGKDD